MRIAVLWISVVAMCIGGCSGQQTSFTCNAVAEKPTSQPVSSERTGLSLSLVKVTQTKSTTVKISTAQTTPLSQTESHKLWHGIKLLPRQREYPKWVIPRLRPNKPHVNQKEISSRPPLIIAHKKHRQVGAHSPNQKTCQLNSPAHQNKGNTANKIITPLKYIHRTVLTHKYGKEVKAGVSKFRAVAANCTLRHRCAPLTPFCVRFNRELDHRSVKALSLSITPQLPHKRVQSISEWLCISGMSQSNTRYRVLFPPEISDISGQRLGVLSEVSFYTRSRAVARNLWSSGGRVISISNRQEPIYKFFSINKPKVEVQVYAVKPDDWSAALRYEWHIRRARIPHKPPGLLCMRKHYKLRGKRDELVETRVNLQEAIKKASAQTAGKISGHFLIVVSTNPLTKNPWHRGVLVSWVQISGIALDAFVDQRGLLAWVTELGSGKAIANAKVTMSPDGVQGISDQNGIVQLALPEKRRGLRRILIAQRGTDSVILPENDGQKNTTSRWVYTLPRDSLRWHIFGIRKQYTRGEMLQVKAWIRRVKHLLQQPQLSEIGHRVRYKIIDGKGQLLHSGSSAIGKWGGIALQFKLPYHAPVGQASIHFTSDLKDVANVTARQVFAIKDHRPPQRMIKVWPTTRGPYVAGEAISLRLQAALAAEQPLSHTEVSWRIVAEQKAFAPLQHRNFLFGNHLLSADASTRELAYHQLYRTKTDSYGQCNLRIKFEAPAVHTPMYVTVRGEIPKLHNASTALHQASRLGLQPVSFLLHPASYYVGLRTERVFVERGNALTVEAIVTDLSGRLISAVPISITATRLSANSQICKVISSTSEASRCNFQTTQGGIYEIKAVISDPKGRRHATVLRRWVLDPMMTIPAETNALHKIKLLANREFYQLGDIARIVVRTANYPRHGLLLLHNGNIFLRRQFYMTGSMIEFNLPIERKHIPHFYACAYFSATSGVNLQNSKGNLAQTAMTDLRAGDVTTSCIRIDVPPVEHKLSLMLHTNHDNVEQQGAVTSLNIDVRYSNGVPVPNAEIALLAAREAKLSPTSCNFSEPLASFYAPTSAKLGVTRFKSTMSLFGAGDIAEKLLHRPLAKAYRAMSNSIAHKSLNYKYNSNRSWLYKDPIQLMPKMPADMQIEDPLGFALHTTCGGRSIDKGNHPKTKFLFLPSISTDEKGRAEVRLQLPLSFAKYHILAVAAAGDAHFGSTIHTIQAAKRLQIISAMPRYLHRGDLFDLPVILHNPTDRSIEVNLVARATGLTWRSANSLKVQVPARQRVQLKLPFTADHTNTAHLQIGAFWEQHNEVKEFTITLLAKNDETAITSGVIAHRGGISLPLQLPPDAITETGGLEFRAMTSAVLHLEELWKQLQTHRAGTEPSASRLLAALSLLRLPPQLRTPAFQPKHLRLTVRREVLGLSVLQNNDGGFPLWQRGDDSWPFVSIHVSHALLQARLAGFAIPPNTLRNALLHLEQLERVIPKHYPQHIRQKLLAYRWNVLHLAVRSKIWRERKSYKNIAIGKIAFKNMPLEAIAWLYPMFAEQPDAISNTKQIRQILRSKIKISVDKAGFVCNQQSSGQLVMFSPQRTSALILKGLLRDLNRDPMIPQLAQGLVSLSNQTRHRDTQTCVWTILALTRYLRNYRTPIHHAQVKLWLGKHLVINSNMRPNITGSQNIFVPIKKLWDVGTKSDLLLHKSGNGPLHYQIKLALNTQKTLGGDHYMTITRQYLAAEPSSNIHRKPDGSLQIKVGTILKVQLKIKICSPRYHIALRDFIPAGFTVISEGDAYSSAALSTNDPATSMPTSQCAINAPKPWFDYRLLQREQIELCALALETGVYHYSYLIRADFTGNFAAPAPNISESHNPKNYARYHSTHITIAD